MVQHRDHATCVMASVGDIPGCSTLNHLNLNDIPICIATPNSITVFKQCPYHRLVSRGIGCFASDSGLVVGSPQCCMLFYSLVYVSVPGEGCLEFDAKVLGVVL